MTIPDDVVLVSKARSPTMRLLGLVLGRQFMRQFWTTYRWPFQRQVRIAHPAGIVDPDTYDAILEHELLHAETFRKWWGPWALIPLAVLLPLPIFLSGRWFIERHAYLLDIRRGRRSVDQAVSVLWHGYGMPWPRKWMHAWFTRELLRSRGAP